MGRIYTSPAASHLTSSSQLTGHFTPHGMLHTSLDTSHLTCWFTTHSRFTPHGLHLHLMGSSHSLMGRFTPHGPLHTSWAASHLTCWFTARDHQLHSRPHGLRSWPRQPRGLWGGGGAGGGHLRTTASASTGPRASVLSTGVRWWGVGSHQGFEHSRPHRNTLSHAPPRGP